MKSDLQLIMATIRQALNHILPSRVVERAALQQGLRLKTWRENLMLACFVDVTVVWFLAIFLGLALLGLVLPFVGMAEWVQNLFGVLTDSRPGTVAALLAIAVLVSFLLPLEAALIALVPIALVQGLVSLSGALALFWGARLGTLLRMQWRGRVQIPSVRKMLRIVMGATSLGILISFFALGYIRDWAAWSFPIAGMGYVTTFLILYVILLAPTQLLLMGWGHWAARQAVDDVMESASVPEGWLKSLGQRARKDLLRGVEDRLAELRRVRGAFTAAEAAKIPPVVLKTSDLEVARLERVREQLVR